MAKQGDTLPTKIAQHMLQRIVSEEFPAGMLLPSERELQDEYQVSRAVIREAIKLLASRKLVTISRGQGAVVASNLTEPVVDALLLAFHRSQIHAEDIYSVRNLLEPQAAALAAQNATLPQIRRLTELANRFEHISFDSDDDDKKDALIRWGKLDREFHQLLAEASQNAVLGILIAVIVGIVWNAISNKMPEPPPDRFTVSTGQHKNIALAIAQHDAERAREMMREHIQNSLDNVVNRENHIQIEIEHLI